MCQTELFSRHVMKESARLPTLMAAAQLSASTTSPFLNCNGATTAAARNLLLPRAPSRLGRFMDECCWAAPDFAMTPF